MQNTLSRREALKVGTKFAIGTLTGLSIFPTIVSVNTLKLTGFRGHSAHPDSYDSVVVY